MKTLDYIDWLNASNDQNILWKACVIRSYSSFYMLFNRTALLCRTAYQRQLRVCVWRWMKALRQSSVSQNKLMYKNLMRNTPETVTNTGAFKWFTVALWRWDAVMISSPGPCDRNTWAQGTIFVIVHFYNYKIVQL